MTVQKQKRKVIVSFVGNSHPRQSFSHGGFFLWEVTNMHSNARKCCKLGPKIIFISSQNVFRTKFRSNYVKWPKLYKSSEKFFKTAIINKWKCHVRNNYHQPIIHYFHKNQSQKNQWSTRLLSQPKSILKPLNLYTFTSSSHKNNNGQRI